MHFFLLLLKLSSLTHTEERCAVWPDLVAILASEMTIEFESRVPDRIENVRAKLLLTNR